MKSETEKTTKKTKTKETKTKKTKTKKKKKETKKKKNHLNHHDAAGAVNARRRDHFLGPREPSIRQFLLTNLTQTPAGDGYMWKVNVEGIARNFNPHISTFPAASLPLRSFEGETAFVAGALSDYLRPEDEDEIETFFPQASFHYLEGAGHWLHADRPQAFLDLVTPLLLP
ncbi:protein ABHD11-like [Eriocheir sinensis]|uniref:protein ABHD11-like n=1 Tax=Eriocheir sinensis TaxID=95602 RepID=UPI0021C57A88|nr:protein ABHD11-like [Eriocheir sinensis]